MNIELHAVVRQLMLFSDLPERVVSVFLGSSSEFDGDARNDEGILKGNNEPNNQQHDASSGAEVAFVFHTGWATGLTRRKVSGGGEVARPPTKSKGNIGWLYAWCSGRRATPKFFRYLQVGGVANYHRRFFALAPVARSP
jgi:hypothetical protein